MAGKKKCFSTIRALRRLDPATLCDVLGKFPAYLKTCGLKLLWVHISHTVTDWVAAVNAQLIWPGQIGTLHG